MVVGAPATRHADCTLESAVPGAPDAPPKTMSNSPKIIPFRILLRLVPRAAALLGRIIALRAAKWSGARPARTSEA